MLFDVLARAIVIDETNNVLRVEDVTAGGVYSVTIPPGTYYLAATGGTDITVAVALAMQDASLAFGLSLDWQIYGVHWRPKLNDTFRLLIDHDGAASAFLRLSDPLSTFPVDIFGLGSTDVEITTSGLTQTANSTATWVAPVPVYHLDDGQPQVDVQEMETPSGRSFRVKHSDVKRFRPLGFRYLPRARTFAETGGEAALETHWARLLLGDFNLYRSTLNSSDPDILNALNSDRLVGTYRLTGDSLTGFRFRRSASTRMSLFDVDLNLRAVVP